MRVGLEWLREWVASDEDAADIAARLTTIGLEVESVERAEPTMSGVVVAQIAAISPHPETARLSVCRVADGSQSRVVVCGAPNVSVGHKVALALPGARLPNGVEIAAAEVHGIDSAGMLCSAAELGFEDESEGLLLLDADAPLGVPLWSALKLGDPVFEINLTPNRGDCFSVLGLARELAAAMDKPLRSPEASPAIATTSETVAVRLLAPHACPRFAGRVVRGLDPRAQSPLWLQERLRRAGLRPIHPIVDVTNYVMVELGQPLHAYDLAHLRGGIRVRLAHTGESMTLLDGRRIELQDDVLVIADESGPVGLAGIMGGASTAVGAQTTDIFLESAFFTPESITGRPRRNGLHTDASLRFERGVDPEHPVRALERATELLLMIAGGRVGPISVTEAEEFLPQAGAVRLRRKRLDDVLGLNPSPQTVASLFRRLEMQANETVDGWMVTPPLFRFDIAIEEDLIEEVGRMIGYDSIPADSGLYSPHLGSASEMAVPSDALADELVGRGYNEIVSYSFIAEQQALAVNPGIELAQLQNPISRDLAVLRPSLWPGLLTAAQRNQSHQQQRLRLFEVGQQFHPEGLGVTETNVIAGLASGTNIPEQWGETARSVDFFDVKADVEALLTMTGRSEEFRFVADEHPALRPGQTARVFCGESPVGWLGTLHPKVQRAFDLRSTGVVVFALQIDAAFGAVPTRFRPYSRFPSIRRDLALLVPRSLGVDDLLEAVQSAGGAMLQNAFVFDVYLGENIDSGRKSVALGLILQGTSRTLTDEEADRTMLSITQRLEAEFGARIRT